MNRFLSPFLALSLLAAPGAGTALADVTVDTGKSSARGQGDVDVGRGGVDVDVQKDRDRVLDRDDRDDAADDDVRVDVPGADKGRIGPAGQLSKVDRSAQSIARSSALAWRSGG